MKIGISEVLWIEYGKLCKKYACGKWKLEDSDSDEFNAGDCVKISYQCVIYSTLFWPKAWLHSKIVSFSPSKLCNDKARKNA